MEILKTFFFLAMAALGYYLELDKIYFIGWSDTNAMITSDAQMYDNLSMMCFWILSSDYCIFFSVWSSETANVKGHWWI